LFGGAGDDNMNASTGDDVLNGGLGADFLFGDAGADVFDFDDVADSGITASTWDQIQGFVRGTDLVDLSGIAATYGSALDFNGASTFAGNTDEVIFQASGGHGYIMLDLNGDDIEDMTIQLRFVTGLDASNLILV
jgi:Ca2+-binding RTX toxin-like protein